LTSGYAKALKVQNIKTNITQSIQKIIAAELTGN